MSIKERRGDILKIDVVIGVAGEDPHLTMEMRIAAAFPLSGASFGVLCSAKDDQLDRVEDEQLLGSELDNAATPHQCEKKVQTMNAFTTTAFHCAPTVDTRQAHLSESHSAKHTQQQRPQTAA